MLAIRFNPDVLSLPEWSGPVSIFLVKATVILTAGVAVTRSMYRASAGARHLVWLAVLGTLLVMPALTRWARFEIPVLPPLDAVSHAVRSAPETVPQPVTPPLASVHGAVAPSTLGAIGSAPIDRAPATRSAVSAVSGLSLLVAVWAGVVLVILASLIWSGLAVRRIVRRARLLEAPDWRKPLLEVADRLGLSEPPRLLVSRDTRMPFACGVVTPTIVLPEECVGWPLERRRAVLLHELAHVRRRDMLGHVLGRVVCALYWFHPLAWVAAKRLRMESEGACDDLALACGTPATDYAEHLLDIVVSVRANRTPVIALAMARRHEFEGRMLAILDPERRHSTPSGRQSAAVLLSLALGAGLIAAAAPVARTRVAVARPEAATDVGPTSKSEQAREVPVSQRTQSVERRMSGASPAATKIPAGIVGPIIQQSVGKALAAPNGNSDGAGPAREPGLSLSGATITALARAGAARFAGGVAQGAPDDRAELLAKVLRSDSSARLRRIAAWGLEQHTDSPTALDALVLAVRRDADPGVREMSAWSLGSADDHDKVIAALAAALRGDANEQVRATATWASGNIGSGASTSVLTAALSDSSRDVRIRAVWGLGNVEPKRGSCRGSDCMEYRAPDAAAPPALVAMLKDRDRETRRLVAWALYQIKDPATLPALQAAMRTETDEETRLDYLRAIAVMGDKSLDVIRGLLESPDAKTRSQAVRALAGGEATGPWPWPWPEPRPEP